MPVTVTTPKEPLLKHLNMYKTPHVIVTAEDDDFDNVILDSLRGEGFNVQYVSMGDDKAVGYAERLHAIAKRMTGLGEHYAIVGIIAANIHLPRGLI